MAEQDNNPYMVAHNVTDFFSRKRMLYAIDDIRITTPLSFVRIGYTILGLVLWVTPMVMIFGIHFNVYYATICLAPPIAFGYFASKPIWGGRELSQAVVALVRYMREPYGWADLHGFSKRDTEPKTIYREIWISRRREYDMLLDLPAKKKKR